MISYSNILLLSGTGRNVGKTSFACSVIKCFAEERQIIAVKFSPHFHQLTDTLAPICLKDHYQLYQETDMDSDKDSARFLRAGAFKSYYVLCRDHAWLLVLNEILSLHLPEHLFIIESGSLAKNFKPGLSFLITDNRLSTHKKQNIRFDRILDENSEFRTVAEEIEILNNRWCMRSIR
jgi:hypothetical protein